MPKMTSKAMAKRCRVRARLQELTAMIVRCCIIAHEKCATEEEEEGSLILENHDPDTVGVSDH
jgi:hypothetical protein